MLKAAVRLEPLDLRAARDTYLDALIAGHFAGRLATDTSLRDVAAAGASAPDRPSRRPRQICCSMGWRPRSSAGTWPVPLASGKRRGIPRPGRIPFAEELRWLWPAAHVAMSLWDDESYEALAGRHIELARKSGLLAVLPTALTTSIVAHAFAGNLGMADELTHELQTLADTMGMPMPAYGPLFVAAWRGDEATARAALGTAVRDATAARGRSNHRVSAITPGR